MDLQTFYRGDAFEAYEFLGAHIKDNTVVFRVFAPMAKNISLMGDFNDWVEQDFAKIEDGNFWECTVPNARESMMYKYKIYKKDGSSQEHCDPYGFGMELRPGFASVIRDNSRYEFTDKSWLESRTVGLDRPVNIYELHAGSWKRKEDGSFYNYVELAEELIPYVKKNGYNYIELMPLSEHPSDESWGYQNTGFFAPSSRYGTADQLKELVNRCHENQIAVIMDFVPVHFALDSYAMINFDGTALYEYPHPDVGHSEWGSCNFMHSRGEVRSFLQSAANYWLSVFHFDGLRMDAIRNIIYWQGNEGRGVNLDGVNFLRNMNAGLKRRHPSAMLSAEDSSNYPGVTRSVDNGGLGFDYKWNMGWMHDTLEFFQTGFKYRSRDYHKLTFSISYFYGERYLLPLSHDEVVHGKATVLQKMYGDYEGKFPQARALYMYMAAHPGKKLNFMGNEIGQIREWDEGREQDWLLLLYPKHLEFAGYINELNRIYLETPALSKEDYHTEGFKWVECNNQAQVLYAFERSSGLQRILFVMNLSDRPLEDLKLNIENCKELRLLLSSEAEEYGGSEKMEVDTVKLTSGIDMPPCSGKLFEICN